MTGMPMSGREMVTITRGDSGSWWAHRLWGSILERIAVSSVECQSCPGASQQTEEEVHGTGYSHEPVLLR